MPVSEVSVELKIYFLEDEIARLQRKIAILKNQIEELKCES